jgi:hypothetical protein
MFQYAVIAIKSKQSISSMDCSRRSMPRNDGVFSTHDLLDELRTHPSIIPSPKLVRETPAFVASLFTSVWMLPSRANVWLSPSFALLGRNRWNG